MLEFLTAFNVIELLQGLDGKNIIVGHKSCDKSTEDVAVCGSNDRQEIIRARNLFNARLSLNDQPEQVFAFRGARTPMRLASSNLWYSVGIPSTIYRDIIAPLAMASALGGKALVIPTSHIFKEYIGGWPDILQHVSSSTL